LLAPYSLINVPSVPFRESTPAGHKKTAQGPP